MDKTQQLGELLEEMLQDLLKNSDKPIDELVLGEFSDTVAHSVASAGLKIKEHQAREADRLRKERQEQEEKEKEEVWNGLFDNLYAAIDTQTFNYNTAAAACTLALWGCITCL